MTVAVMWEAAAADGRGAELLAWARENAAALPGTPQRREYLTAPAGRVLVITWWDAPAEPEQGGQGHARLPELPDPPADLVRRDVHRWRFASVGVDRS